MKELVILIGASGHGKVVADIVRAAGDRVLGFLDDRAAGGIFCGYPILGKPADYGAFPEARFVISIGNGETRKRIAGAMPGARWYTAVHPSAVISPLDTEIAPGTVVMANAVVNPGARIGRHCIVNTCAVVEHDDRLEDFVHVSVGAKLAGTVQIGEGTWVGIGAAVSNNLRICGGCMIGAGAVVVKDITEPGTYVGVPARRIS